MNPNIPVKPVIQPATQKRLPSWLTTVTLFSKLLAMTLFIALPFLGFYLGMRYQEKITVNIPVVSENQKTVVPTPQSTIKPISGWITHKELNYNFSFQYPSDWGPAKSETISADATPNGMGFQSVSFSNKDISTNESWSLVQLTKYSDYNANQYTLADLDRLKNIFNTKSIDAEKPLWMPSSNAAIIYSSDLSYVENANSSLRGIFYFSITAQNPVDPILTNITVILTDGKNNIIQFYQQEPYSSDVNNNVNMEYGLCNDNTNTTSQQPKVACKISKKIFNDYQNFYKHMISTATPLQ